MTDDVIPFRRFDQTRAGLETSLAQVKVELAQYESVKTLIDYSIVVASNVIAGAEADGQGSIAEIESLRAQLSAQYEHQGNLASVIQATQRTIAELSEKLGIDQGERS